MGEPTKNSYCESLRHSWVTALTFWLLPLQGSPVLPFTLLMLIPSFFLLSYLLVWNFMWITMAIVVFYIVNPNSKKRFGVCVSEWCTYVCGICSHHTCESMIFCVGECPKRTLVPWSVTVILTPLSKSSTDTGTGVADFSCLPSQRWCYNHARAMPRFLYVDAGI